MPVKTCTVSMMMILADTRVLMLSRLLRNINIEVTKIPSRKEIMKTWLLKVFLIRVWNVLIMVLRVVIMVTGRQGRS